MPFTCNAIPLSFSVLAVSLVSVPLSCSISTSSSTWAAMLVDGTSILDSFGCMFMVMNGKMSLIMTTVTFWKSYVVQDKKISCLMYDCNKRNRHHKKNATYKNKLRFLKSQQRQSCHGINWISTLSEWMLLEEFHIPFLCFPSRSWCLDTSIPLPGASSQLLSIDWADKLNRDRFPLLVVSTECPACTFGRRQQNNKSAFPITMPSGKIKEKIEAYYLHCKEQH